MEKQDIEALVKQQQRRFPAAYSRAQAIVSRPHPGLREAQVLLQQALHQEDEVERLSTLMKAASAWADPYVRRSACRKGCSHCCRIRLVITEHEANALQRATGRAKHQPARPITMDAMSPRLPDAQEEAASIAKYTGVPCPFLDETSGECTAYEARPFMCRLHMNLDTDNLLCHPSDPSRVNVPEPNNIPMAAGCLAILGTCIAADIREWFPPETAPEG